MSYGVAEWLRSEVVEDDLSADQKVMYLQAKQYMHNTIDKHNRSIYEKEADSVESVYGIPAGTTPSPAEMWDNANKLFYPNARKANRQYRKQFFSIDIHEDETLHNYIHKIEQIGTTSNGFITSNYKPPKPISCVSECYYKDVINDTKTIDETRKSSASPDAYLPRSSSSSSASI